MISVVIFISEKTSHINIFGFFLLLFLDFLDSGGTSGGWSSSSSWSGGSNV